MKMAKSEFLPCAIRLVAALWRVRASHFLSVVVSLGVFVAGLSGTAALASQSEWQGDPAIAEARLVSAVEATGSLETLPLGLEFRVAPGWKIYWRTPGEAGLPPSLDFSDSPTPNLEATLRWPLPKRFNVFGFDNFGYQDHVILPLDVQGHAVGGLVQISARMEALVCADICVPVEGTLSLLLPDGPATSSPHAREIARYAAQIPRKAGVGGRAASGPNLAVESVGLDHGTLFIRLADGAPAVDDIFVEGFDGVAFKAPVAVAGGYRIETATAKGVTFAGGPATLTVVAGDEAAEFAVNIAPLVADTSLDRGWWRGVLLTIAIAMLGGLILNLMPCVLPVLALKLSSVLGLQGQDRQVLRRGFLAGAAGIVTSFILLALALLLVRYAGGQVGWGIQFQSPVFLGVMMVLLGVFALSLADMLTIPVPAFAARLARPSGPTAGNGMAGNFLSGMLATILATPCSAPFVGTAVTVALTGDAVMLFAVFLSMGFGLALPWLVVAAFPEMVRILPRPGPWMVWMKRCLAILLLATVVWLGSIMMTLLGPSPGQTDQMTPNDTGQIAWQKFDPDKVPGLVASGKIVFVDVTADWCITCKANKTLVLERMPVSGTIAQMQAQGDLVAMQADWTRPDPSIADYLASFDRFGIPFDAVYGPAVPDGLVLPELLTGQLVLDALESAQNTPK